jgi:hypothetical protein
MIAVCFDIHTKHISALCWRKIESFNQVKDVQQMLKGVVSGFLLCSLNYSDMFRLPNVIFRVLQFPFISYASLLVCVSGGCELLFTGCVLLLRNASQYVLAFLELSFCWTSFT